MTRRDAVLGTVRWCAGCREWWPDDAEFFIVKAYRAGTVAVAAGRPYVRGSSGVTRQCKACHAERVRRWKQRRRTGVAA